MTCPLCGMDTESPLGHLLLCGARFKREAERAKVALGDLVSRLDAIEADDLYKAVWVFYAVHGNRYDGPTYAAEKNAARAALAGGEAK